MIPYIVPSTVSKKTSKTKKMILFEKKSRANSCNIMDSPYLCIVFFIVLDLRLTRLGYSGIPFFLPLPEGLLVAALFVGCGTNRPHIH